MTGFALDLTLGQDWPLWAGMLAALTILFVCGILPTAWRIVPSCLAFIACLWLLYTMHAVRPKPVEAIAAQTLDRLARCGASDLSRGLPPGLDLGRIIDR